MTRIRQHMIEDMKVRNLTPGKELRRARVTGGAREGRPSLPNFCASTGSRRRWSSLNRNRRRMLI